MGIGRRYFNKLYRAFTNTDIPEDLRLDLFQASVIGGSSYGSAAWAFTPAIVMLTAQVQETLRLRRLSTIGSILQDRHTRSARARAGAGTRACAVAHACRVALAVGVVVARPGA